MTLGDSNYNSNSSGSCVNLFQGATTALVSVLLVAGTTIPMDCPVDYSPRIDRATVYATSKNWEDKLSGFDSSHRSVVSQAPNDDIDIIISFAQKIIQLQEDIPMDFEEVFLENYEELLA